MGFVAAGAASLLAQAERSPETLARALQQRYQAVRDFRADFVQTSRGGALGTESRGEGSVSVKKPGRMRWVYTRPERQEIISDGVTLYRYFPEDREVDQTRVPPDDQATTSMQFLAGRGDITRDFTAAGAEPPVAGTIGLKLTPRNSEPDFEHLVVGLDPKTLQIRALTTRDRLGADNTIVFRNMRENTGVPDSTFAFTPPKGVRVQTLQ
jgi:outer membrane lipoprotein carrier protein